MAMLLCFGLAKAQDTHFSQFYANPLYLSPSLAGATDGGRFVLNYRNQWPSITKAYSSYAVSFDNFFNKFNSGIGVYLIQDKAGSAALTTTNAAFQYSYNFLINSEWQVVPGIQFEYGNKAIDFSKLRFSDEESGGGASGAWDRLDDNSVSYFDLAASAFLYNVKYWAGVTVNHLGRPNFSFLGEEMRMPVKMVAFGGMNVWSDRRKREGMNRAFSASFRYEHQQRNKQLDVGVYWYNGPLELGFWYRGLPLFKVANATSVNHDAIIALLAYNYGPYRIGYSYDITLSGLGWQTAGAHEISIIYEFNQRFNLRLGGRRPAVPCSTTADPANSSRKYLKKHRKLM